MGGKGSHPWSDHYNLPKLGVEDDIKPLTECIEIVKEWSFDPREKAENCKKQAEEYKRQEGNEFMEGYTLERAGLIIRQEFCFECNVFNTEESDYSIPEDITGWYAVIVDMHN